MKPKFSLHIKSLNGEETSPSTNPPTQSPSTTPSTQKKYTTHLSMHHEKEIKERKWI